MAFGVECTWCGRTLRVPESSVGKRGKCPACGAVVDIPAAPPDPAFPPLKLDEDDEILGSATPESDLAVPAQPEVPAEPAPSPSAAEPATPYEYKMVQIPPTIQVQQGVPITQRAAAYLQEVVNTWAKDGWEFYRVDPIGIRIAPGCLGALFGQAEQSVEFYVITFRRRAS